MTSSRQVILDRITRGLAAGPLKGTFPAAPPVALPEAEVDQTRLVDMLVANLSPLPATWEFAESPVAARLGLVARLQSQGVKRVLSWAGDQLPVDGILAALEVLGIEALVPDDRKPHHGLPPDVDAIDVGITGVDAALADTGTLVLYSGTGRSLLVSHLPRFHVAILPVGCMYPCAEAWLRAARQLGDATVTDPAQIALITGPSQSLDIELTPVIGLHGPRQLHVVILQNR